MELNLLLLLHQPLHLVIFYLLIPGYQQVIILIGFSLVIIQILTTEQEMIFVLEIVLIRIY